jgi:hypothetical protein
MADFIPTPDLLLATPALIFALLGLMLAFFAVIKLLRKRIIHGCIQGTCACGLLGIAAVLLLLGSNLYTYQRLTYENEIARIEFWQSGTQQYLAVVSPAGNKSDQSYTLSGDEWQLDARVLKWTGVANLAGLNSRYRLERLSGRYRSVAQERSDPRTVFPLSTNPGLDLWQLLGKIQAWTSWVDTYYGSSTYMPMADQAAYQVVLTQSGLVARPANAQAQKAVREWR